MARVMPWLARWCPRFGSSLRISDDERRPGPTPRAIPRSGPDATPAAIPRTGGSRDSGGVVAGHSARTAAPAADASACDTNCKSSCRHPGAGSARHTKGRRQEGATAPLPPASPGAAVSGSTQRSATSTAARMISTGALCLGNQRSNAAAPWATSMARPSAARRTRERTARTQDVSPWA
jgi:hypothetical protein